MTRAEELAGALAELRWQTVGHQRREEAFAVIEAAVADAEALAEALEYVDGFRERLIMGGFSHIASRVSRALARYRGEKP